ncbi:Chromosome-partitioning protein Spo0J [Caulifigura coniformis]|uniref:Chromosome-partitioning protein Spo0J n=1 Tax=Caulifigura coniformis TaxID=2527983 RepID=A0A517SCK2_9PLAN|nr:ParB/RepB/Spo0J family partition protein [Caulifigura coniformis]QDT53858.1 Chromosome-partitioning protein Spo0J [Caulifigura coniformis]
MNSSVSQNSIPINRIRTGPNPLRLHLGEDTQEMQDLITSIREFGVLEPVGVCASGDGYLLIFGNRRLHAAKQAGIAHVPAVIHPSPASEADFLALQIQENEHRVNVEPVAFGEALKTMQGRLGCTQAELARRMKMNPVRMSRLISLASLPDPVKALVAEERLPVSTALELAQLDVAEQASFILRALKDGVTRDEVVAHRRASRSQQSRNSAGRVSVQLDGNRRLILTGVGRTIKEARSAIREALGVFRKAEQAGQSLETCIRSQADRFRPESGAEAGSKSRVPVQQEK